MFKGIFTKNNASSQNRRKDLRRKIVRRRGDREQECALSERYHKYQSLLELGQIIGLELQLNEMLLQIAQKACEVMEADRCSLFIYDPKKEELWSTVAMGMGEQVIRIPVGVGVAGSCFQNGKIINLEDAYKDPRFNKEVDIKTGYHTRSLLCMPFHNRDGSTLGVIQLLNKRNGVFDKEDEVFLKTFGNHTSVFIEMAQLQQARIEALEQSRKELERLNKAKSKALNHLSHELKTPLSIIQGNLRLLKRKLEISTSLVEWEKYFENLGGHLNRLFNIHEKADMIIQSYQKLDENSLDRELDQIDSKLKETSEVPADLWVQWKDLKSKLSECLRTKPTSFKSSALFPSVQKVLEASKQKAKHREIKFLIEGRRDLEVSLEPEILEEILEGLLKNAIENTPDEGIIQIILEKTDHRTLLKVKDFGVGITQGNQEYIFDGLFTTQETDLYSSKKPYDFNAGGKGLDLLRMKVYGQRFGFDLSLMSHRCVHLPTDQELCPGRVSTCPHCQKLEDCLSSGGSTFCVSFPTTG